MSKEQEYPLARAVDTSNRVLTIPNTITLIRIVLIPVFVYLGWHRSYLIKSGILLGFIGATDWLDGFLARRLNQTSVIGKIIDPSADRLLLIAAGIVAIHLDLIPLWILIVIFARELIVSAVVGIAMLVFKTRFDVVGYGKAGTLLMMFGFPFLLSAGGSGRYHLLFSVIGYGLLIPGVGILFIALGSYAKKLYNLAFVSH